MCAAATRATASALPSARAAVVAAYSGDAANAASASATLSQVVNSGRQRLTDHAGSVGFNPSTAGSQRDLHGNDHRRRADRQRQASKDEQGCPSPAAAPWL